MMTADYTDKEKLMTWAVDAFRMLVQHYKDSEVYCYAVHYSHALIDQIERTLYPGKIRPEVTRNSQRMNYQEFMEYMKNPLPGDMVTVIDEDGGILSRIIVRTVIDNV